MLSNLLQVDETIDRRFQVVYLLLDFTQLCVACSHDKVRARQGEPPPRKGGAGRQQAVDSRGV